jgi:hypothetical protein
MIKTVTENECITVLWDQGRERGGVLTNRPDILIKAIRSELAY